jgi:hypothetical protein
MGVLVVGAALLLGKVLQLELKRQRLTETMAVQE